MIAPAVAQAKETDAEVVKVPPLGEIEGVVTVGKGLTAKVAA